VSGCVGRGPSALLFPGVYNDVKMAVPTTQYINPTTKKATIPGKSIINVSKQHLKKSNNKIDKKNN